MKKSLIALSVAAAFTATGAQAVTVLPAGANLTIDAGSFFAMGAGAYGTVPLLGENGITVGPGTGDTGTGSHGGDPVPSDVGAATQPWSFFYNTGYDYVGSNGSGSFGGSTETGVDMSAWTVTWNTIANIPMGGCSLVAGGCTQNPGQTNEVIFVNSGIGDFTWDGNANGGAYTITYTATVPVGDPSNFGGVQYDVFLTGTVVPVPAAVWLFGSGLLGLVGIARRRKTA